MKIRGSSFSHSSSIYQVNSVSYQCYKFDKQPRETTEYNFITAHRKHVMKALIINILRIQSFSFFNKCQVWGQFVVVFISVGTGDGCLLMVNLSVIFVMNHLRGSFFSVVTPVAQTDEPETLLPLVLPHQDVISSLKAYQAGSNDTEWLNCVFWWISLWVIWCHIVFHSSYCSAFRVCK